MRYSLAFAFICYTLGTNNLLYGGETMTLRPDNTIIAFDLHDVIFTMDYKQILATLWHSDQKWRLIAYGFHPKVWYDLWHITRSNSSAEKYFMELTTNYGGLKDCMPTFIKLTNAQKPVEKTIAIIKRLKLQGYTLHILSNIGAETFKELNDLHPEIFELFDAVKVVSHLENHIGKPHKTIFDNYIDEHNNDGHRVILIDDKKKNIQAAREHGMIGIRFIGHDNLIAELQKLGLL